MYMFDSSQWLFKLVLAVCLFTATAYCQFPLRKVSNVTIPTDYRNEFRRRYMSPSHSPPNNLGVAGCFDTNSEFANGTGSLNGTVDISTIYAAAFTLPGGFPTSMIVYYDYDIYIAESRGPGSQFLEYDFSTAGALMANAYTTIEEVDPRGVVVQTADLSEFHYHSDMAQSGLTANNTIYYYTLFGHMRHNEPFDAEIRLTYIMVTEPMVVNYLNTTLLPKSYECIVKITKWDYRNMANHLRLTMMAGSGGTSFISQKEFVMGQGDSRDGEEKDVQVSDWKMLNQTAFQNKQEYSKFFNIIYSKYGNTSLNQSYVATVTVEFPANAKVIEYDPTTGTGTSFATVFSMGRPTPPVLAADPIADTDTINSVVPSGQTAGGLAPEVLAGIVLGCVFFVAIVFVLVVLYVKVFRGKVTPWKDRERTA